MSRSLRSLMKRADELIAIAGLNGGNTLQVEVRPVFDGIFFHIDAVHLVKLASQFGIPRSKVTISMFPESIHATFLARGAQWTAVVLKTQIADFYSALGVELPKLVAPKRVSLPHPAPKRIAFREPSAGLLAFAEECD